MTVKAHFVAKLNSAWREALHVTMVMRPCSYLLHCVLQAYISLQVAPKKVQYQYLKAESIKHNPGLEWMQDESDCWGMNKSKLH